MTGVALEGLGERIGQFTKVAWIPYHTRRTLYVAPPERRVGAHMSNYASGDVPEADIDPNVTKLIGTIPDSTQASMMAEAVLQVDENDVIIGPMVSWQLFQGWCSPPCIQRSAVNSDGKLCLTTCTWQNYLPKCLANSCCSLTCKSDEMEETDARGVKEQIRKLDQELGISNITQYRRFPLCYKNAILQMNAEWIEREIDHILLIKACGTIRT